VILPPLHKRFSFTSVMVAASVLASAGLITSGFASNIASISITLGVLHSIGSGTVLVSLYLLTMMYFSKFRGVAHGAASLGKPLSDLIFTELLQFFKGAYGARGSLFLLGALSMHLTPLTLALRVPFLSKTISKDELCTSKLEVEDAADENWQYIEMQELERPKQEPPQSRVERCESPETPNKACTEFRVLFARPVFYIVIISSAVTAVIDSIFLTTVIDFAVDQGSVISDAAWLKPCYSVASAMGRVLLPLIADRGYVRRSTFVMLSHVLVGVTLAVVPIATKYWMVATLCALTAAFLGGGTVMHDVLVVDYLSLERLSIIHGAIGAVKAPLVICSPLLIGE
ncbi:unnamed protein product, partial [Ixodes hexagonus]